VRFSLHSCPLVKTFPGSPNDVSAISVTNESPAALADRKAQAAIRRQLPEIRKRRLSVSRDEEMFTVSPVNALERFLRCDNSSPGG